MFLDKKVKNRYTIGKELRKMKGLRKKDPQVSIMPLTPQLEAYKQDLEKRGLVVGAVDVGLFQTRNGLKYPGFVAKQTIDSNSVLLRVPVDCLLTTRDAFVSQIQKVFEENPKFYAKTFSSDWQDRIILTYLLFEYQKGKESKWYHLLANLPREIDYVAFWPQNELKHLQDDWVSKRIVRQRDRVLSEQQQLISIAKKYPQHFDIKFFTPENITWIHVHLVTRCFGKYFEYTTMVPYAQLFNHECVDVYYTMAYKQDNPNNPHDQMAQAVAFSQEQEDEADTSQGSYNASDVSCEDEDFDQSQVSNIQPKCSPTIISQYKSINSYLMAFINFNDQFSLHYLQKIYTALQNTINKDDKLALEQLSKIHSQNVKYVKLVKEFFYKIGSTRYTYGLRQKKIWRNKQNKKEEEVIEQDMDYFSGAWPKDKFDQFLMVCGSKDQFQAGSQVYFCYGRLPNRLLLMRYGIALEHNKYNHLFIRMNISDQVYKSPPLQRAVQSQIALKKYRRFKIKRTAFCIELVTFYRSMLWKYGQDCETIFYIYDLQRQLLALKMTKVLMQQKMNQFSCTLQQNQKKLQDKSVDYHEYFAVVYRLEQQRILAEQISMLNYSTSLISLMQNGQTLECLLREQKEEKMMRYQLIMELYFKSFKYF